VNDAVVADTMAVVLRLERRRLPQNVRTLFEEAERGIKRLYIPAMVMAEIGYLSERGRIETNLREVNSLCESFPAIKVFPITREVILKTFEINDIPELHDRIIAGTAYSLQLPLLTNDPIITGSRYVTGIW
jgi:predicted nucleic acid-binding protein